MNKIFSRTTIGKIPSRNALVRSATHLQDADGDGLISQRQMDNYDKLSVGGTGVLISGMVGIDENSRISTKMTKCYGDDFKERLPKLANLVKNNDSRLVIQLAHTGIRAIPDRGNSPLGPSALEYKGRNSNPMTLEDIDTVIENFAKAAKVCKDAGADGVQIHSAHEYLLSQFLSPYFNKRSDNYGGYISGRARLVFQVYDAIRDAVGSDYPLWVKINSSDFVPDGMTFDECLYVCKELDKRGIDAIEVSGGIGVGSLSMPGRIDKDNPGKGTFSEYAEKIAKSVHADVISVGGYRDPETIEKWLNRGIAAISICRPLMKDPDLPNRWMQECGTQTK